MRALTEWLREIDHTADAGVEITASSLPELYERAAYAMFWLMTRIDAVEPVDMREVSVHAGDREAIMVSWLSELNYIHQVDRMLFSHFVVDLPAGNVLRAKVYGEPVDPTKHEVYGEIKAVTFHGLKIAEQSGSWTATVIFDI